MYKQSTLAALLLSASTALASNSFVKRDSWGAAFSLGPAKQPIISTTTTIYPGKMPSGQEAYLFAWLGISNGTGDLIQSIVGSYPSGGSECGGQTGADTTWCISSEVYGSGYQYVGELTTADVNYENGIKLNYTLIDSSSYLWLQTMEDAVTGTLLSTYNKTSGPMLGWGTALECDDLDGVACTGTDEPQYYVNSTIILDSADDSFSDTLGAGTGVVYTDMETADGGKTWTIAKITIPAMEASSDSSASSASASVAATSSVAHVAVPSSSVVAFSSAPVASAPAASAPAAAASSVGSVPSGFAAPSGNAAPSGFASPTGFGSGNGAAPSASASAVPTGFGGFGSGNGHDGGRFGGHGSGKFGGFKSRRNF